MFFYFIFHYLLSKEINTCLRIQAVYFYKKYDGELDGDMFHNYPKINFFFEGIIMGHNF